MAFSFGFSGDDIEPAENEPAPPQEPQHLAPSTASAFPVPGKPQLPPTHHPLSSLIAQLPSKIAYSNLDVTLDDGTPISLPRRELWDVRVQLMAEDDGKEGTEEGTEGLGQHDVKTGVYEGGFKSWESSVDLVKVLTADKSSYLTDSTPLRVIELGCGTALPSLAIFSWIIQASSPPQGFHFVVSDYNPTVLQLVTMPNFILTWALLQRTKLPAVEEALAEEGELELTPEVLDAFNAFLAERKISFSFVSGAWSQEFVNLIYAQAEIEASAKTCILGAETIYSPFALQAFAETILHMLQHKDKAATVYVGAKNMYFGVGGSLDDFVVNVQGRGLIVTQVRSETDGVRRGVVCCMANSGAG